MKKILISAALLSIFLVSCASTSNLPGKEEYVEYKDMSFIPENKLYLTQQELREDCDMLKYGLYNSYAGIDEAIENGFDLDATIEDIYNQTLKKKAWNNLYSTSDFQAIIRSTMSKKINNTDQHISIAGNIKDSVVLRISDIFFNKIDDEFFVSKSDVDTIKEGDKYTGPIENLYPYITADGLNYRFCVMTNKNIKSAVISINDQKLNVPAKAEKPIPTKEAGTGYKSTNQTLYMSLGDCSMPFGIGDAASNFTYTWDNYLANISENAKGKNTIIFDLRSNPGGYMQFPAKILTSAFYFNHADDPEFQKDIYALFWNKATEDCVELTSPIIMQLEKKWMNTTWTNELNSFNDETQAYFKNYFRTINIKPLRKPIPLNYRACSFTEFPEPDFKGDVYVLINQRSASAAEFGTQMAYLLKDKGISVTLVGENSWGGIKYGGMIGFSLPHSGLYSRVGIYLGESHYLQEIPNWKGEGSGFYPDYWATNDTILDTLIYLTGDKDLESTLEGLDKSQL